MNPFQALVYNLNAMGFFGFILPWLFTFAVVFGILVKTKPLGDDNRVSAIVAMVIGFFVVGFGGVGLANFFVNIFGMAAAILAGILVLVLFMGMAGIPLDQLTKSKSVLALLVGIAVLVFAIAVGGWGTVINQTTVAIVLVLIFMAAAVALITSK